MLLCGRRGHLFGGSGSQEKEPSPQEEELHELHDKEKSAYIPPEKWGINREDLKFFEREVKQLFDAGQIPKSSDRYNTPPHAGAKEPNWRHDDPHIGPSIYQVNTHYIKPMTREHQGKSWALTRHKDGLDVDCFATHAWIEGVWEFIKKVRQSWPRSSNSLYICFLGNPQFGVKKLLMGGIKESPFYRALKASKTMIVIPNHKVSIYTRKWCVYEAYLSLQYVQKTQMKIVLPWVKDRRWAFLELLPSVLFGLGGWYLGYEVLRDSIGYLLGPVMWLLFAFVSNYVGGWVLRAFLSWVTNAHDHDPKLPGNQELQAQMLKRLNWSTQIYIIFQYFEITNIFAASGLAWSHFEASNSGFQGLMLNSTRRTNLYMFHEIRTALNSSDIGVRYQEGEEISCLMVMFALAVLAIYRIVYAMIRNVVKKSSGQLYFTSVTDADCTSKDDEDLINRETEETVDEIDRDINRLRNVGRYNQAIAKNLDLGMSPGDAAEGINLLKIVFATLAFQFWWVTDLAGSDRIWEALAVPIASIMALLAGAYYMGDVVVFAIDAFTICGVLFLTLTNHTYWFESHAVKTKTMSRNTLGLQLICLFLMIPFCSYHYLGIRRAWHDWLRHHKLSCVLAGGQSTDWHHHNGAHAHADYDDDEEATYSIVDSNGSPR